MIAAEFVAKTEDNPNWAREWVRECIKEIGYPPCVTPEKICRRKISEETLIRRVCYQWLLLCKYRPRENVLKLFKDWVVGKEDIGRYIRWSRMDM